MTIYVIGLILIPLIWGIWQYDTIKRSWDDDNYIVAAFVIGLWPITAFLGIVLLGVAIVIAGPFFLFKFLQTKPRLPQRKRLLTSQLHRSLQL